MVLLSWNVQWCRGMDGHVDPKNASPPRQGGSANPDVICLQEVARNFPEMEGSAGEDQVLELMRKSWQATKGSSPRRSMFQEKRAPLRQRRAHAGFSSETSHAAISQDRSAWT